MPAQLASRKIHQLAREESTNWPMRFQPFRSILDLDHQPIGREAMSESKPSRDSVKVTLIIVVGIVILTCILAFTAVSVAFVLNAPW